MEYKSTVFSNESASKQHLVSLLISRSEDLIAPLQHFSEVASQGKSFLAVYDMRTPHN